MRIRNPTNAIEGNSSSESSREAYLDMTERRNGMLIPPTGIASFIIPITVPDISLYMIPASVMISGKMAEMVPPEINRRI